MAVFKDVVSLSSATNQGTGLTATRGFVVTDLSGSPEDKIREILLHPDIPKLGNSHPTLPALACTKQKITFIDGEQANVSIDYEIPKVERGDLPEGADGEIETPGGATEGETSPVVAGDEGTISVASAGSLQEISVDTSGNELIVAHIVDTKIPFLDETGSITTDESGQIILIQDDTLVEQKLKAEITVAQPVLRISRLQRGSPDQEARFFVGTVNSKAIGDDGPRRWMCTRIDGNSTDGGKTFQVTYEFQYNNAEWGFLGEWLDPETNLPIAKKDYNTTPEHQEKKFFLIYEERDFNILRLNFSGALGKSAAQSAKDKDIQNTLRGFAANSPSSLDELFR